MQGIIGGRLAPCQRDKATKERYNEGTKGGLIMKRLTILASVLIAATLLTSPALAQHQPGGQMQMGPQPGQPPGQPPTMGPGMMGGGQMGPGMGMGQSMMMCPMMHQMMHQMMMGGQMGGGQMGSGGMMGMMGGQMDPKTHGRMLQMRGEMLKAAGDILLTSSACGLCHTDLHEVEGELRPPKLPIVPGHQIVGVVEARGDGARRFAFGERVGGPWLHSTCGACAACRRGDENLCDGA